jgi:tetratricopeptide (TPR) repeat protein
MQAAQQVDAQWCIASLLNGLGEVRRSQARYEQALDYFEQALKVGREIGNLWINAHILDNMGHTAYAQGRYQIAADYVRQSMEASVALGDERGIAMCLEKLGGIALARQQPEHAARFLGAAEALREARNTPVEGMDAADYQRFVEQLQSQLPADVLDSRWQEGRHLPLSQIIDQALAD